jgi:mannan endo-1,4-beta-mannosidase
MSRTAPREWESSTLWMQAAVIACSLWAAGCAQTTHSGNPQGQALRVQGRFLFDICGEPVVIRGIEDSQRTNIDEIAKAQSNAVRLVYRMDAAELESKLKQATDNKLLVSLIPGGDGYMDTSWWGREDIKAILMKYQPWLLPHAYGEGAYTKDPARWLRETKEVISALRGFGYQFPIELLADQWGQQLDTLLDHGREVLDFDPEHNVILGNQMYSIYHPDDATIASIIGSGLPIMLGSCSFRDPSNPSQGWYDAPLDQYKLVWQKTYENQIGSFYWDWGPSIDGMTTDGHFGSWTDKGQIIANSGAYSLPKTAKKTTWMLTGKCAAGAGG